MNEPALPDAFLQAAGHLLGDALLTDRAACLSYGVDNSRLQHPAAAVALPDSHDRLCALMALCHQYRVAVIPRGRGTGTTGAVTPLGGELVISFERMNRIVEIDPANRLAVVEPGVTNQQLQNALAEHGFFWPPDPTSADVCTIGGNLAYNSAGPRAVKYGSPRENTLGLTAVTADGQTLLTGARTTKAVVGYDLTRLLIGSEGTLALITQAILKLTPLPPARRALRAGYRSMQAAAEAVSAIMAQPVIPAALEFIDPAALKLARNWQSLDLPESVQALLLMEIDGQPDQLDSMEAAIERACRHAERCDFAAAANEDESARLWAARKALSPSLRHVAPKKLNEDVVVPVSRMGELIRRLEALSAQHKITIVNFGHAGNGNIHVNLLYDPDDPDQARRADACLQQVFQTVLELGGTLSGEHGIGRVKRAHAGLELHGASLKTMWAIKRALDPLNLLNPGKTLPDAG